MHCIVMKITKKEESKDIREQKTLEMFSEKLK